MYINIGDETFCTTETTCRLQVVTIQPLTSATISYVNKQTCHHNANTKRGRPPPSYARTPYTDVFSISTKSPILHRLASRYIRLSEISVIFFTFLTPGKRPGALDTPADGNLHTNFGFLCLFVFDLGAGMRPTDRQTDRRRPVGKGGLRGGTKTPPPNSQKYTKKVHTVCISKIQGLLYMYCLNISIYLN